MAVPSPLSKTLHVLNCHKIILIAIIDIALLASGLIVPCGLCFCNSSELVAEVYASKDILLDSPQVVDIDLCEVSCCGKDDPSE